MPMNAYAAMSFVAEPVPSLDSEGERR